jgi:hypothetical protein
MPRSDGLIARLEGMIGLVIIGALGKLADRSAMVRRLADRSARASEIEYDEGASSSAAPWARIPCAPSTPSDSIP